LCSRFVYEQYYWHKAITKELYEWCLREVCVCALLSARQHAPVASFRRRAVCDTTQGYADINLIAKWKKPGYERLCCLRCIQSRDHNFMTTCICRVPSHKLESGKAVECVHCGCRGCASGDGRPKGKKGDGAAAGAPALAAPEAGAGAVGADGAGAGAGAGGAGMSDDVE
jgi:hypothetical protein